MATEDAVESYFCDVFLLTNSHKQLNKMPKMSDYSGLTIILKWKCI